MDIGPVIAQRRVAVLPDDSPAALHARIQVAEDELYPAVIRQLAESLSC